MADLSDVINCLVDLAQTAVYPNGLSSPSVSGTDIRIYGGWPVPANLDADLSAGITNISIYPTPSERPTTRFPMNWHQSTLNPITLTLTVNDATTVIVGGTVSTPQTCMVTVNGIGYAYAVQTNDTLTTIASNIANLIAGATSVGPVITIANAYRLNANISVLGSGIRELKRQERVFMITTWAHSDPIRSVIASAMDVFFAFTERFVLPDNYYAGFKYNGTRITDMMEKANLYRRDLLYTVDYPTTQTEEQFTIADIKTNLEIVSEL